MHIVQWRYTKIPANNPFFVIVFLNFACYNKMNCCMLYSEGNMINIRKPETELWGSADLLRQGSKPTSNQYCMPVLGLIFLRYAYSRL